MYRLRRRKPLVLLNHRKQNLRNRHLKLNLSPQLQLPRKQPLGGRRRSRLTSPQFRNSKKRSNDNGRNRLAKKRRREPQRRNARE